MSSSINCLNLLKYQRIKSKSGLPTSVISKRQRKLAIDISPCWMLLGVQLFGDAKVSTWNPSTDCIRSHHPLGKKPWGEKHHNSHSPTLAKCRFYVWIPLLSEALSWCVCRCICCTLTMNHVSRAKTTSAKDEFKYRIPGWPMLLVGGNSKIFFFHPELLGKMDPIKNGCIFFNWGWWNNHQLGCIWNSRKF